MMEESVLVVRRVGVTGQRTERRKVGPGEASAIPKAAGSQAVVETLSHCGHAPKGVWNKFWNLLSCLPPDPSSCLSLAEPNWKPEIKLEEVMLRGQPLGSRKWILLVSGRTAEAQLAPSVGTQHRPEGSYCLVSR